MRNYFFFIILLLVGCTSHAAYTAFCPTDAKHWAPSEPANIAVNMAGTPQKHTLYIGVRTTKAHRYDGTLLPLEITQKWEHLMGLRIDTLFINITDTAGHFTGSGVCHHDILTPLCEIQHDDSLKGTISIRPCLSAPIHGISHVGVEIRPSDSDF